MITTSSKLIRNTYLMISGLGGFLLFSILAMIFYTGGSSFDRHTHTYNFFENYISDLGLVSTPAGRSNNISLVLFAIAMLMIGILCIPFMISFYQQFPKKTASRYIAFIGGIIGMMSAIGYIGVGLTPMDEVSFLHTVSVTIAFGGSLWAAFLFAIAIFLSPILPKKYGFVFLGITVIIGIFTLLELLVIERWIPFARTFSIVGQKITVYFQLFLLLLAGTGILHTYRKDAIKTSSEKINMIVTP